jgi:hypothetical protein
VVVVVGGWGCVVVGKRHDGQFAQPPSGQRPPEPSHDAKVLPSRRVAIYVPPWSDFLLAEPARDEPPFEACPPAHGYDIIARSTATPQAGLLCSKFMIQCFVDASPHGVLTLRSEIVFYSVPEYEDDDEDGDGDYEPPFQRRVFRKGGYVHAEEADCECQREKTNQGSRQFHEGGERVRGKEIHT